MFCTKNVLNVRNNFCKQLVLPSFELLSYCGLVDSKIRDSSKDLPVSSDNICAMMTHTHMVVHLRERVLNLDFLLQKG